MFNDESDRKYVTFFEVPKHAFQSVKLLRRGTEVDLYENLF